MVEGIQHFCLLLASWYLSDILHSRKSGSKTSNIFTLSSTAQFSPSCISTSVLTFCIGAYIFHHGVVLDSIIVDVASLVFQCELLGKVMCPPPSGPRAREGQRFIMATFLRLIVNRSQFVSV